MPAKNSLAQVTAGWPTLPSGVPYSEKVKDPRSPQEELRNDGSRAITTIQVPWFQRLQAAQDILGYATVESTAGVKYIQRVTPRAYSPFTVNGLGVQGFLYATQILRMDPVGMPDPVGGVIDQDPGPGLLINSENPPDWLLAKMQVLYESLTYDVVADVNMPQTSGVPDEATLQRYISPMVNPSGDAIPLPNGAFKYVSGIVNDTIQGSPSFVRVYFDWILVWELVPKEAIGNVLINPGATTFTIDNSLGRVNSVAFPAGAANQCPPGTLLLTTFCPRPVRSTSGARLYRCEFRMKYFNFGTDINGHAIGHNHLLKTDGKYYEISTTGNSNYPYTTANTSPYTGVDFNAMFRPT